MYVHLSNSCASLDTSFFFFYLPFLQSYYRSTVTYMLEGEFEHEDFLGNSGLIGPGDVQVRSSFLNDFVSPWL
jgi:hypothetical protein